MPTLILGSSREGPPVAVDLFCGAGGMSLGLKAAGFQVAVAIDNWEPAVRTYAANFGESSVLNADLGTLSPVDLFDGWISPGAVDLVAGGPPCQGFSIQRIGPDNDPRNHLVLSFGEHVAWLAPKLFVMENVPGLMGSRGRELFRAFIASMEQAGYRVDAAVIDAADFGVPQRRRRVIVAGVREDVCTGGFEILDLLSAYNRSDKVTVIEAIGDLPSPPMDHTPFPGDPLHRRTRLSSLNQERLRHVPQGGGFEDLPLDLRVTAHRQGAKRIGHRNVYGRLHPGRPAATITARFDSFTRGQFAHPVEDRNITLREGARLQTFPDHFIFHGTQEEIAALIGNAVPPELACCVGSAMKKVLPQNGDAASVHSPAPHDELAAVTPAGRDRG